MTGEAFLPPTELPEAVAAQLRDVRAVLHGEAVAAGVAQDRVDAELNRAAAGYRDAHVHGHVGVLVEREVREALGLRRRRPAAAP